MRLSQNKDTYPRKDGSKSLAAGDEVDDDAEKHRVVGLEELDGQVSRGEDVHLGAVGGGELGCRHCGDGLDIELGERGGFVLLGRYGTSE